MNFHNINKYCFALVAMMGLGLTSCRDEAEPVATDDNTIVLKAQMKQTTAQTEAAMWQAGEKVAVVADGKTYRYTLAADGSMSADGSELVWNGSNFNIKAWTPVVDHAIALTDQTTTEKMASCDLLSAETNVSSRYVYLIFNHNMTRMTWVLDQVDNSYTQQQINDARVYFLGYGSVNFTNGTVATTGNPNSEISTLESVVNDTRQGEAIMAPADMWEKPLIKIEIGGDEYTYVPSRGSEADTSTSAGDLVGGKWQRYNLSISRKTLSVTMQSSDVEWGNNHQFGDNDITDAKLEAEIAQDVASKPGYTVSGIQNGYISDRAAGFSISYNEDALGGLSWTGNCKVTRTETLISGNTTRQTYTFSDVKSDITVTYLASVQEGYYLYDNGTWGEDETREGCKTIGRVFHVGLDSRDDSSYDMCKIRGYVVPLQFGNTAEMQWFANQSEAKYIQALANIPVSPDAATRESYYGGYKLTKLLQNALAPFSSDWAEQVPFWYAFKNIDMQAPTTTSGWYIPTYAQLKDLCASDMYDRFIGTYWSSQVYPGTGNAAVGGVEEGEKTTLWAIRCSADQAVGYGWAIDRAKLITILTF